MSADGQLTPVEHKAGARHGLAADVQLCAQALCLEEMFHREVRMGWVWYAGARRRRRIELDDALRAITISVIEEIRYNIVAGYLPPPVNDERCRACQLEPTCLPKVVFNRDAVARYVDNQVLGCE